MALTSSTKVTRLISCKVETPEKTFFRADSRRLVSPSASAAAADFRARPPLDNHLANVVAQVEQFVNRRAAAIARVIAGVAADIRIERRCCDALRDARPDSISSVVGRVIRPPAKRTQARAPDVGPARNSKTKRSCKARRPCSEIARSRRSRCWRERW